MDSFSLIGDGGDEVYTSSLALFQHPNSSSAIERIDFTDYQRVSQISPETSLLEFQVPGTSSSYIDLKATRLHIQLKITKSDGSSITTQEKVGLINLPLHTIWSQVDLSLQNQQISPNVGQNYAYKSYLDVLLHSDPQLLQAQLTSQLFFLDDADYFDNLGKSRQTNAEGKVTQVESTSMNSGLRYRSAFTETGQAISLEGPVYLDFCQQNRFLVNGVPLRIRFYKNKDNFCLLSDQDNYRVHITDAVLKVCSIKVNPGILVGHGDLFKNHMALYPFTKSDIKCFSIPKGQFNISLDNLYQGAVPSTLTVGLVTSQAYSGSYRLNPFNFYHFNCNFCGFYVDSQSVPGQPFTPNFQANSWVNAYLSLFHKGYKKPVNSVSLSEFPNGFCLYRFTLQEETDGSYMPLAKRGHTRLDLKFAEPLPESITLIAYATFPSLLRIDESRNVIL